MSFASFGGRPVFSMCMWGCWMKVLRLCAVVVCRLAMVSKAGASVQPDLLLGTTTWHRAQYCCASFWPAAALAGQT
jgi:hypothetical protein